MDRTPPAPPHPIGPPLPWRARFGAPAIVATAAVAAYLVALGGGFVWDDCAFLPAGPRLTQVTDPRVFFRHGIFAFARIDGLESVPVYRPLTTLIAWLLEPLLGADPAAWHLLPIGLHAVCTVLVYALARRWIPGAPRIAAMTGALLFAVLPVHAESVAYISGWGHPFTTLLVLLSVHAALSHARRRAPAWLAATAILSTLAVLSSEGALVLPALIVGAEWLERGRRPPVLVWVASALAAALPLFMRSRALESAIPLSFDVDALLRAVSFAPAYLRELVSPWPAPPHGSYPRGGVAGVGTWLAAVAVLAGAGAWLRRLPRGERARPLAAIGWIVATLAPLVAAGMNAAPFFAPRALYLPSVGLALLVSLGVARLAPSALGRLRWVAVAIAAAGVAIGNVAAAEWRDDETVRRRMLEVDPEAASVHIAFARIVGDKGRVDEAVGHLEAAIRLATRPADRLVAKEALAPHLAMRGRLDEAARLFEEVLREAPDRASAWNGAGSVALMRRDLPRARACYERALTLAPGNGEAAFNLATVLDALGDRSGAAAWRQRASALGVGGTGGR